MPYPCPACGFEVFDQPPGSYDLCSVCDWEDDVVQLRFPAMRGGANGESLFHWQQAILRRLPSEISFYRGFKRCDDWRPLSQKDFTKDAPIPKIGIEYFEALGTEDTVYYWHKNPIRNNQIPQTPTNLSGATDLDDETFLIRKLAKSWHLSVAERQALPNQTAKAGMVCQAIAEFVSEKSSYPPDWRIDEGFDGGLIELKSDGRCDIHWMAEVSMMRFDLQKVDHHRDAFSAANAWLRRMFPRDIDGVPLDWNA